MKLIDIKDTLPVGFIPIQETVDTRELSSQIEMCLEEKKQLKNPFKFWTTTLIFRKPLCH